MREVSVRRHVWKLLLGSVFVFFLGPEECWFLYCDRHDFNPPICQNSVD